VIIKNKHRNPIVAVNAIIFDTTTKVLLTKRKDKNIWCLPGGIVEAKETISQALVREVKEEICVDINIIHLIGVYSCNNINPEEWINRNSIIISMLAEITDGQLGISDEVEDVDYFELTKLPNIIKPQIERIFDAAGELTTPVLK